MQEKTVRPFVVDHQIEGKTVRSFGIRDKFGYLFGDFGNDFFLL